MPGPETIHRIVEKLEVVGGREAQVAFDKLGNAAEGAAKALNLEGKSARGVVGDLDKTVAVHRDAGKAAEEAGKAVAAGGGEAAEGLGKWIKGMTVAHLAADLLSKAIGFVIGKLREMVTRTWDINVAIEAAGSRIQGMALGLMDLEKLDPMERIAASGRIANVTLAKFRDIAMKTATPIAAIEGAYAGIAPILAGLGRSQKDLIKFTEMSASAARVYGERAEMAGSIVAKAIFQGVVEGETAFARAFKAQAQITAKDPLEKRIQRVTEVLKKMGAPVETVTRDTAGALDRWRILSEDVLQRVTLPVYQKIGQVVASIVDWAEENKKVLDAIVVDLTEWLETGWSVVESAWETWRAFDEVFGITEGIGSQVRRVWETLKFVGKIVDMVAFGFRLVSEQIMVIIDPERGVGKLAALSEAVRIKWLEIGLQIVKVVQAFAKVAVPKWLAEKIPGVKSFFEGMEGIAKDMERDIKGTAQRLRSMEKTMGIDPLTETTRAMKRASDAVEEAVKGMKAPSFNVNIAKVEIRQDFRDQDPDRVIIEMVQDLERLGENAIQSAAGGPATAFVGGAAY